MTGEAAQRELAKPDASRLDTREWMRLALCSLATIMGLCAVWAGVTRMEVPREQLTDAPCMILIDPVMPVRGRPNTTCSPVLREMGKVEYRFNECGHRTDLRCAPAPSGTFRIVAIGSSIAEGAGVPVEDAFVSRLPAALAQINNKNNGRKFDAYNTAMIGTAPRGVLLRIDEVFPLKPDLVLWPLTVFDIDHPNLRTFGVTGRQAPDERRPMEQQADGAPATGRSGGTAVGSLWGNFYSTVQDTRYVFFLKHLLYGSQSLYESHFGATDAGESDPETAGFIDVSQSQIWQQHLEDFEFYFRQVASQLSARGIPLAVVLLPHRVQMDMVSTGHWPPGKDPYALNRWLEPIVRKYDAAWFDILHDFRNVPDPDRLFFPVNGHMNAEGHHVVASLIAREMSGAVQP